jgi:hypothetical protein
MAWGRRLALAATGPAPDRNRLSDALRAAERTVPHHPLGQTMTESDFPDGEAPLDRWSLPDLEQAIRTRAADVHTREVSLAKEHAELDDRKSELENFRRELGARMSALGVTKDMVS